MAASTNPVFIDTPKSWIGRCTVANTGRDGTGTIATIVTPGSDGSLIEGIEIQAEATTAAACLVNLFLSDDGGTTWRFWRAVSIAVASASTSVDTANGTVPAGVLPLPLASTQRLGAACTVSGNFVVVCRGGDY